MNTVARISQETCKLLLEIGVPKAELPATELGARLRFYSLPPNAALLRRAEQAGVALDRLPANITYGALLDEIENATSTKA